MYDVNQLFDPANTAITVTATSTNVLDFLAARDIGVGDEIEVHVDVQQTFTAGGAATLQIALQGCATSGGTYKDLLLSPVMAVADLVAGARVFRVKWPVNGLNNDNSTPADAPYQFYRLNYTVATGPMTAGQVVAYITGGGDREVRNAYPIGYKISA